MKFLYIQRYNNDLKQDPTYFKWECGVIWRRTSPEIDQDNKDIKAVEQIKNTLKVV